MRFGVCAGLNTLEAVSAAGFDYLEPAVTGLLQPELPEADIMPPLRAKFAVSSLKPETFNLFLPGDLKSGGAGNRSQSGRSRYLEVGVPVEPVSLAAKSSCSAAAEQDVFLTAGREKKRKRRSGLS